MRCFFMLSVYIRATVLSIENRKFRCFADRTCDFFNKYWQNVLTSIPSGAILTMMIPVVRLYAIFLHIPERSVLSDIHLSTLERDTGTSP